MKATRLLAVTVLALSPSLFAPGHARAIDRSFCRSMWSKYQACLKWCDDDYLKNYEAGPGRNPPDVALANCKSAYCEESIFEKLRLKDCLEVRGLVKPPLNVTAPVPQEKPLAGAAKRPRKLKEDEPSESLETRDSFSTRRVQQKRDDSSSSSDGVSTRRGGFSTEQRVTSPDLLDRIPPDPSLRPR